MIYDTMTVFDNLAFPLRNQGLDEARILIKVNEIADVLDLQPLLKRKRATSARTKSRKSPWVAGWCAMTCRRSSSTNR